MNGIELLFGDSLKKTVLEIVANALEERTLDSCKRALGQLAGIGWFINNMHISNGLKADISIRLSNEERRLELLAGVLEKV
jgi:hypothetical protein